MMEYPDDIEALLAKIGADRYPYQDFSDHHGGPHRTLPIDTVPTAAAAERPAASPPASSAAPPAAAVQSHPEPPAAAVSAHHDDSADPGTSMDTPLQALFKRLLDGRSPG